MLGRLLLLDGAVRQLHVAPSSRVHALKDAFTNVSANVLARTATCSRPQIQRFHPLRTCRKPLNRRYIVVEGLYQGTGDLAPLAQIAALKRRYKYRLVVDESLAVGALGPTGRGAAQHCGLQPQDVDIVCSSLGERTAVLSQGSLPAACSLRICGPAWVCEDCQITEAWRGACVRAGGGQPWGPRVGLTYSSTKT